MNSKRQLQKEKTRELLINHAIHCFAKDGLLNTKTSDIAEAAGVAHGTIFVHFPTRDDLVASAIHHFGQKITRRIHELANEKHTVREGLEAHLQGLVEFEEFYTKLAFEGHLLPDSAHNALVMIQSAISFHLIQAAESEMNAGTIRRMPSYLFFNTWIGLIHYYLANKKWFAPDGSVLQRYGQELLEHFLFLVSKEE